MGDSQFEHSSAELQRVLRVRFGILSPDETKAMSVCEVTSPVTYINGTPADNGLLDLRMGTMERNFKCRTCAQDMRECPGHFGHIELARPCLHISLITTVVKVLRCVCFHCSSLLISKDHKNYPHVMRIANKKKRLAAMLKVCQGMKRCNGGYDIDEEAVVGEDALIGGDRTDMDSRPSRVSSGCGNILPVYRVEEGFKVMITFPEDSDVIEGEQDRKKALSAGRIHEILKRVSDDDVRTLGFDPVYARPDWFVITVLAVPPPPVRPSVMFSSSARSSDDLTYKLADIVKINQQLRRHEQQGAAEPILQDYSDLLQYHVATLMDNELSGQPQSLQRSGKPIKSIRQRLVGKAGRVRGNLMGKRVDFSARSVITPDPNLGIDQLGVPRTIAMNMTIPEIVTPYNIDKMRRLVRNGPSVHPGAKNIIRDDGKLVDLRFVRKSSDLHLEVGYRVERHIDNNDPVVFNRQPSLHKMSMMGHRIKVMPWSTFRLNLSCTSPYNADFDGDEMNLHVPQCFPEVDTRVLTDTGLLFLDEIEARLARGEQVLYACYQRSRLLPASSDDMLKGELVYRSGKLVYSTPPRELIVFNSSPREVRRWTAQSDPDANTAAAVDQHMANKDIETDDGVHCVSRHISLRVTPQHNMYVKLGNRCTLPEKVHASTLLSDCSCPPTLPGEPDCIHRRASVTMLACADAGRQPSSDERSDVRATVQGRLGLSDVQFPAFLELFGFWLAGGGAMNYRDSAVKLSQANADDVTFVDETLAAVGLRPGQFYRHEQPLPCRASKPMSTTTWQIADKGWFNFFDRQSDGAAGLPRWILHCLTPAEARKVVSGLWRANETWSTQEKSVRTCDIALRDQLMQLLLHCGFTASTQLIHHAGTICGYRWWDTAADATVYSVTEVVAMGKEEQALYRPIESAQASWEVTWADTSSSVGKEACWPSMLRQQAVSTQTYSPQRDGRIWCVTVDHDDHLIFAQRAERHNGVVTRQSRPVIVGQSYMTQAEIREIILSPRQVVSPQANKPVMGIVQDTLLGCMKFTFRDTFLSKDLTFNTLMNLESWDGHVPIPAILKPAQLWTGKQVFSRLLPRGINLQQTSNNHPDQEDGVMSPGDTLVRIEQGEIIQGIIDKRTVGSSQGSLIHVTWVEYGPFVCAKLFTEIQKVVNHWLLHNGFSIGIGDGIASGRTLLEIEKTIKNAKREVSNIIRKARSGKLERTPGRTIVETFEQQVNEVLNKATNSAGS